MSDETRVITTCENNVITRREESLTPKVFSEFNKVFISGKIEVEPKYSHNIKWEKFYRTTIKTERFSGTEDLIPVIIPETIIKKHQSLKSKLVEIAGQFRSYNRFENGHIHLDVFLFAMSINIYENESELEEPLNSNLIYLDGYICKPPTFRETPLGKQISDFLIAVNRSYGKSDYIPCIAWGRFAQLVATFNVGNRVNLYGRIQSREYFKRDSKDPMQGEYRLAYEISTTQIQKISD